MNEFMNAEDGVLVLQVASTLPRVLIGSLPIQRVPCEIKLESDRMIVVVVVAVVVVGLSYENGGELQYAN